ncbi:hypothetical protein ACAG96_06425 [Candidatus Izemoplasma sp. B36]|uniref:hypothetical protein n=1 Tax=Candidatus Izemoplasma sp. B36 TaxID=3242468 RepID=UPI0035584CE4
MKNKVIKRLTIFIISLIIIPTTTYIVINEIRYDIRETDYMISKYNLHVGLNRFYPSDYVNILYEDSDIIILEYTHNGSNQKNYIKIGFVYISIYNAIKLNLITLEDVIESDNPYYYTVEKQIVKCILESDKIIVNKEDFLYISEYDRTPIEQWVLEGDLLESFKEFFEEKEFMYNGIVTAEGAYKYKVSVFKEDEITLTFYIYQDGTAIEFQQNPFPYNSRVKAVYDILNISSLEDILD